MLFYQDGNYSAVVKTPFTQSFTPCKASLKIVGNKVSEPGEKKGMDIARDIIHTFHQLDASRPVTAGINLSILAGNMAQKAKKKEQPKKEGEVKEDPLNTFSKKFTSEQYNAMMASIGDRMAEATVRPEIDSVTTPILDALDIAGYNYANARYEMEGTAHPSRVIVGSETMCYNLSKNWEKVERLPYVIGDFQWTAWDYIGETGIGGWYYANERGSFTKAFPWLLGDTGSLDILGNPNGEALLAKAVWLKDTHKPYIGVCPIHDAPLIKAPWRGSNSLPTWSWRGCEGKKTQVEVYSNAPKVRLYLNEELVGEQAPEHHKAVFDIVYQPGTLRAVSVDATGKEEPSELTSATGKLSIGIHPETEAQAGRLLYVDINIEGENGIVESKADA